MLYKKTIVLWSDSEDEIESASAEVITVARLSAGIAAFGNEVQEVDEPASDPDYNEIVEDMFGGE